MTATTNRTEKVLDHLEYALASDFTESVKAILRRLNDAEVNTLYLMTHTPAHMGDYVHIWMKVLMPVIEQELELRRDIQITPRLGPILAPELYQKGGGHDLPI
jgi:hypothetical protein